MFLSTFPEGKEWLQLAITSQHYAVYNRLDCSDQKPSLQFYLEQMLAKTNLEGKETRNNNRIYDRQIFNANMKRS